MVVKKRSLLTALLITLTAVIGLILSSIAVCRMCVLLLLIICVLRGIKEKYFLNPYYMFALVPFTLLIYANISNYHVELTVDTWLIAIINISAFIIAMDFTTEYRHVEKCKGVGDGKRLLNHTIVFLVLGFMPTVYSIAFGGTMPLASIFTLLSSGAIMCALKSQNKILIGIVIAVFIFSWTGYVTKSSILSFVISILIGYEKYYVNNVKQKRKLIILLILGLILMVAAFSFANQDRGSMSPASVLKYYSQHGGLTWSGRASLLMPYMYLTTPWANLQYVMETQRSQTYGLWLIKPLLGYFQIDKFFEEFYSLKAYSSFNTFTYIACCFKDFGFFGSCISSVILGVFVKKMYSRFTLSHSPLDIVCYVLISQAVIEMFFSNHFFAQSYPFTIVIIMAIYKMVFCKGNDPELSSSIGHEFEYS